VISDSFAFRARRRPNFSYKSIENACTAFPSTLVSRLELSPSTIRTSPTPRRRTVTSKYSSYTAEQVPVFLLFITSKEVSNLFRKAHDSYKENCCWGTINNRMNVRYVHIWVVRREETGNMVIASVLVVFVAILLTLANGQDPTEDLLVVRTTQGYLKGSILTSRKGKSIYSFRGVRYAQPPVGNLRFKVRSWNACE
jgi:hypothetical protein